MKIVPAFLLAVPLVVDSIVKLEFKMRYDEGGLKVTTTHLSRASIFPVYPALLVRGLIVITPLQWIEYMDTNCIAFCLTFNYFLSSCWRTLIKVRSSVFLYFHACKEHALIKIDHILKDQSLYNFDRWLQYNWLI